MTLEEKLLQMNLHPPPGQGTPGLGSYSQVAIPCLGLGGLRGSDGPRGPRPNGTLPPGRSEDGHNGPVSPTALCLASNWDPNVQEEAGRQWGLLCPGVRPEPAVRARPQPDQGPTRGPQRRVRQRRPLLGRQDGRGLQSVGTAACVKHFVANDWETGRQNHDVLVPERSLRELYLPAFQLALDEGHAWSLMTCYNQVNGE